MEKIKFEDVKALSDADARRDARRTFESRASASGKFALNDIMLMGLVLIAATISFTDFTLSLGSIKSFTALSVFLYVITTLVYRNRYDKGKRRGYRDDEYKSALEKYRSRRDDVYEAKYASQVPEFCRIFKARELRRYRESVLSDADLSYDEYAQKYRGKSWRYVMGLSLSSDARRAIMKCNRAKPIKLTPNMILNENGEFGRSRLIGQSGRERERSDKKRQLISRAIMALLGSMIAINLILDFSLVTVFQWFVRMLPVVSAVITGDDSGFCNVVVTETNFKRDQVAVINLFFEYMDEKRGASSDAPPKVSD